MWDDVYSEKDYVYGRSPNDFLKQHFPVIPKGKVLLLAEGEGRNAVFLAQQGYEVTGVDLSKVGLKKAQKLAAENEVQITTINADLAEFDLGEKRWDGIISIFCHLPPGIRKSLYKRVQKALKPNGAFLLEGYTPLQLSYNSGGPPVAEMMQSKAILTKELPSLTFSYLEEIEREVIEGTKHSGMASVVQAIATSK